MTISNLIDRVRSGVASIEFLKDGHRISSGTGFFSKGLLITNHHVFMGPSDSIVSISVQPTQDVDSRIEKRITYDRFRASLISGSDQNNLDFAILDLPEIWRADYFNFELDAASQARVGESIVLLGFPFDQRNLVCHVGIISSFSQSGPARIIQIDASVNQSNSGGPLLDPTSGRVIGIVTRKATGLTTLFDEMVAIFDKNIQALQGVRGYMQISGFYPVDPMIAAQHQLKQLAAEIQRSANVGIGFAFSAEHLLADLTFEQFVQR